MNPLLVPLTTFGISLLVVMFIYWFAGKLSAPKKEAKYKLKSYACGEDYPGGKMQQSYSLFHVAFLFTILHVGVLIAATAPSGDMAWLGVVMASVVAVTAAVLLLRGGEEDA